MTPEQQRVLALANARLRIQQQGGGVPYRQPGQEERPSGIDFLNQGIAAGLGAPVDMVTSALNAGITGLNMMGADISPISEPFGGSASINAGLNALGVTAAPPEVRPEGLAENVLAGVGGAAGGLVPFLGGAAAISRLGGVAGAGGQAMLNQFAQTPGRALATELAAGGGAGLGVDVAQNVAPGNPYAEVAGALIGGGVAGMTPNLVARGAPYIPGVGMATRATQAAVAPFTKAGALERARNRIAGLVENPEAARQALAGENIGNLSPAAQTGERRLMSLEQSVRNSDPVADALMRGRETETNRLFADELASVGGAGNVSDTRAFLSERVNALTTQMDEAIERASQQAEQKLALLTPSQRQSAASVVVRDEIENALSSARQEESALWQAIPQDVEVPTEATYAAYQEMLGQLSSAQMDTMPAKVRQFLDEGSNQRFGEFETVKEMHGLYSELRKAARQARAADEYNTARIADNIANAIIDDIGANAGAAQGPAGVAMRDAIDYSRQLNERFTQGSIGRVLGYAREGGSSVAPELTLDTTVGRSGIGGAVNLGEVRAAVGNSPATEAAVRDYILSEVGQAAIRNGEMKPNAVANFLVRNEELLNQVPDTQRQIAEALTANQQASQRTATMDARRAAVMQDSQAGQFINSPQGREIANLYTAENPQAAAAQLVKQAQADTSGQAVAGLKSAFVDDVIGAAMSRQFDEAGNPVLSGNAARAKMADPNVKAVASEILSQTEQDRLTKIVEAMQKADMARSGLPDVGPVINDVPNSIISMIFRTIAARQGARAGQGVSGASLLTANFASRRMEALLDRLTNSRAEQLIREAVMGDRELFDSLLANPATIKPAQVNRIIESLMGAAGAYAATSAEPLRITLDGMGQDDPYYVNR